MKRTITLFFSFLFLCNLWSQSRFSFIENKGQWDGDFLYKADIPSGAMFLEKGGITYHFVDWHEIYDMHGTPLIPDHDAVIKGHSVKVNFVNSSAPSSVISSQPQSYYTNFYRGNDSRRWVRKLYPVAQVLCKNIWPGIDIQYYSAGGKMKYDFIVHPGADYKNIQLNYQGADKISLKDGGVVITTSLGEITEEKPFAYQNIDGDKVSIACVYKLSGNQVSFAMTDLADPSLPVIIDPTLIFATYSGSTADNFGMTATFNDAGNLYGGGTAFGVGYPVTAGAYQTTAIAGFNVAGITDVVITKYSPDGVSQVYSTYLGGGTTNSGTETIHSMIVDNYDNLCVYGVTSSNNFPVTTGAYDTTFNGGSFMSFPQNGSTFDIGTDIYVTKFNNAGTALIGSTFIGGSANDGVNFNTNTALYDSLMFNYGDQFRGEIYVDSLDNIYVATSTYSPDFPTLNAYQPAIAGNQDAVVFKFNPTLDTLIFSTFLGGTGKDAAYAIKVDEFNNMFVTGGTSSNNFPTTAGVYQPAYAGGKTDAYLVKISAGGNILMHSTLMGTNGYDQSFCVELDPYRDVYLYGQTSNSGAFPVVNAGYANANSGQFICKFDSTLSTLLFSSKFGNDNFGINISPTAFLVDKCGNIYISGWGANILQSTPLNGMPVTANALQGTNGDGFNFYLAAFSTNFGSLLYGSYFGGNLSHEHVDGGTSRFSRQGVVYQSVCAGCQNNDDFPTTPGVWSTTNNSSNCNNGLFKFQYELPTVVADFNIPDTLCSTYDITFNNTTVGGNYFHWDFGDGDTSLLHDPVHTYPGPGTYVIELIVIDTTFITCVSQDTMYKTLVIVDDDTAYALPTLTICQGDFVQIGLPNNPSASYQWSPSTALNFDTISDPTANPSSSILYTLLLDDGTCIDTITRQVNVDLPVNADFNYTSYVSCNGVSLALNDLSIGADSTQFFLNFLPLPAGSDSVVLDWSSSYIITLWAYNGACIDSMSLPFNSGNFGDLFDLDMPNVFTPFNTAGLNDQFCPIGLNGEYCYKLHVFNRWGTEIWESEYEEPCWDGLHKDTDNPAVDGVYYFVVEFQGGDQASFFHLISHIE